MIVLPFLLLFGKSILFSQENLLIQNVTVIPMNTPTSLVNQSVLISHGKIQAIASSSKIKTPPGCKLIDGKGKYLVPGLFDMHAHFFREQYEDDKNTTREELKMMLANGITSARIMAGHPEYLAAKAKLESREWEGPDITVASPQLVGAWPWPTGFKNYEIVNTPQKATEAVKRFKQEGYDAIKITFMVDRECYDAIVATAKEVGIKVVGHVGPKVKLPAALLAQEEIEHMDEFIDMLLPDSTYNHGQSVSDMNIWSKAAWSTLPSLDESKITALVQQVKASNVYVTPTNYFFISTFGQIPTEDEIRNKRDYSYIPVVLVNERWKNREHYIHMDISKESREKYVYLRKKMVNELSRAGVPLMAGSDSPEFFLVTGFSIHDELAAFTEAGLSNFSALKTATVTPAAFLGLKNRGSVEIAKDADLILLDKDPLANIRNTTSINAVIKNGKYLDRKTLDAMLASAKAAFQ